MTMQVLVRKFKCPKCGKKITSELNKLVICDCKFEYCTDHTVEVEEDK